MKVRATIEGTNSLIGDTIIADIDARDRRAFEREGRKEFGIPANVNMQEAVQGIPESYVGWLVWHSLKRLGRKDIDSWKDFESRLIRTEPLEENAEVFDFPTQAAT